MMSTPTGNLRAVLLPATLVLLTACGGEPGDPEAEIRVWLDAMQQAAEEKARSDIMDGISSAYVDTRGHSRDDINNLLRIYFLRQNTVSLWSKIDEISVIDGTAAQVNIGVGMAATNDRALGFSADAYRFELELEHDGDDWLLISARWGQLGDPLH